MKLIAQDVAEGRVRPALKPEERLLLAVVESAYWDLQNPDPMRRHTARSYFLDEEDGHTFSFVAICQHFSWSPHSIRRQLGALLESLPGAAPVLWGMSAGSKAPNASSGR
jgi:hypothetical protein